MREIFQFPQPQIMLKLIRFCLINELRDDKKNEKRMQEEKFAKDGLVLLNFEM